TGLVLLADPPTQEHLRFRMTLVGGRNAAHYSGNGKPLEVTKKTGNSKNRQTRTKELLFWDRRGLGSVRLFSASEMSNRFDASGKANRLGPDALSISVEEMQAQFQASRRPIKVALLDQKLVAGIGNLYASEILHLVKIHP